VKVAISIVELLARTVDDSIIVLAAPGILFEVLPEQGVLGNEVRGISVRFSRLSVCEMKRREGRGETLSHLLAGEASDER